MKEFRSTRMCSCISIGSRLHSFREGMGSSSMLDDMMVTWHKLVDDMRHSRHFPQDPAYADKQLDSFSCLHGEELAVRTSIVSAGASMPI